MRSKDPASKRETSPPNTADPICLTSIDHPSPPARTATLDAPSKLYRAVWWRRGLWLGRHLPRPFLRALAATGACLYALTQPARRRIVAENLLPAVGDDPGAARRCTWRLYRNFGRKLADLWKYEAGVSVHGWFRTMSGWEHIERVRDSKRGALLVTLHLGNWEFGAPLVCSRGETLLVLTQSEPGSGFTELRKEARARQGIETWVVGSDPFGIVEVVRRLQEGASVAALLDRPPAQTATEVSFLGKPFQMSIAAADLARATGCAILPVLILMDSRGGTYVGKVMPEIPYNRAALASKPARIGLSQEILRRFEDVIRNHPDQWFHFVPVWGGPAVPQSQKPQPTPGTP